jgi:hypothetical protein
MGRRWRMRLVKKALVDSTCPPQDAYDACSLTECWCWNGKQLSLPQLPFFFIIPILAENPLITYLEIIHMF